MEILLLIAFVIIIILFIKIQNNISHYFENTNDAIKRLNEKIASLSQTHNAILPNTNQPINEDATALQNKIKEREAIAQQEHLARIAALEKANKERQQKAAAMAATASADETSSPTSTPLTSAKEGLIKRFIKNNPDIEKFIGENLFNKIGIAVLVFGIAFFIKYAIDQQWINEYGRVAIGLLCGALLVSIAHFLRNNYRSFSSVLAGGSIAVFYFTIAFAFHQYHLISQAAAFACMIVITAFAILLSLLYNKIELAIIATIGGFITPFLVSNGSGNYITLFTYLLVLNIGLLVLAYFKKWSAVNIVAFIFTWFIFGGWLIKIVVQATPIPVGNALVFASAYYAIFIAMNLLYNINNKLDFKAVDLLILLSCNALYFAAGLTILKIGNQTDYSGAFTITNAFINLILAYYFFKVKKVNGKLLYLLIGLTLTFISLTAPIQLHGNNITLFWAAETVLLFWLHQQSKISLFKKSSAIIFCLMLFSLLMDWSQASINSKSDLAQIFYAVKDIVTNVVVLVALCLYSFLLKKENSSINYLSGINNKYASICITSIFIILAYITGYFTINFILSTHIDYTFANIYHRGFTYLFVGALCLLLNRNKTNGKSVFWLQTFVIAYAFLFFLGSNYLIKNFIFNKIETANDTLHTVVHWLGSVGLLLLLIMGATFVKKHIHQINKAAVGLGWWYSFSMIFLLCNSLQHLYIVCFATTNNYFEYASQFSKAGYSIIWGSCSFVMIWLGLKYQYKPLRIIAIILFGITLIKLFVFDLKNIGPAGKITAFILLGILLLIVSFMYQRLKKILIDDANK